MKTFFFKDVEKYRNVAKMDAISGQIHKARMDGTQVQGGVGAFLHQQINDIEDAFFDEVLEPTEANFLVQTVESPQTRIKEEVSYRQIDGSLELQELGYRSDDFQTAGVTGKRFLASVMRPAGGIHIDDNELLEAQTHGFGLETFLVGVVARAFEEFKSKIVFQGAPERGIHGLFGSGTIKSSGEFHDTLVTALSGDQLYALLIDAVMKLTINNKQTIAPDRMVIPDIMWKQALKLRMSSNGETVWSEFMKNNPYIKDMSQVETSSRLNNRLDPVGLVRRMTLVVFRSGIQYARMRSSGPRMLAPLQYLQGRGICWINDIADVEIMQPGAFRFVDLKGIDPESH